MLNLIVRVRRTNEEFEFRFFRAFKDGRWDEVERLRRRFFAALDELAPPAPEASGHQ
jgi:hypothetical protein